MPIDVNFDWSVDTKGYRIEHGRIIGNGGPKRPYRLKDFPTLYLIFAKIHPTSEGLLDFANKFGRLTLDELGDGKPVIGDNVRKILPNIGMISDALEILRGHVGKLPAWRDRSFAYDLPNGWRVSGGIPLPGKLSASLAPDPATGAWQFRLQPPTLLDAIWLQFGQAIASNTELRSCSGCGTWFEAGPGSRRRADAKFCSDKCRVEFNSRKRSR